MFLFVGVAGNPSGWAQEYELPPMAQNPCLNWFSPSRGPDCEAAQEGGPPSSGCGWSEVRRRLRHWSAPLLWQSRAGRQPSKPETEAIHRLQTRLFGEHAAQELEPPVSNPEQ